MDTKKAQYGFIVKLEIVGMNNESREGIVNPMTAKFRCSHAKVLDIYHMITGEHIDKIYSICDSSFLYEIGKTVFSENFDENLSNVCSDGIHYFKSEDTAIHWEYIPTDGLYKTWYENGQLNTEIVFKDGTRNGLDQVWNNKGQLVLKCIYNNGQKNGLCEGWNDSGILIWRCLYKDGKEQGLCERWYNDGKPYNYKDGMEE